MIDRAVLAPPASTDAPPATTLYGVPWALYEDLRSLKTNTHERMTYYDGTLIFMSPRYIHDRGAERLGLLIRLVSAALGIDVGGTRTTTLKRKGGDPASGSGKEPDSGFYFGENERLMRTKPDIDLNVDPPPDLAIEVDHTADSELALPVYARLGVPEVWRYKVRDDSLWFGRLIDGSYEAIGRSVCLPVLTPELVLEALAVVEDGEMSETAWIHWIHDWSRTLPGPESRP